MRFARVVLGILLLLAAAWSIAPESKAQMGGNSVNVGGTVTDQSGAVIPGATVTIHNPVSGLERTRHDGCIRQLHASERAVQPLPHDGHREGLRQLRAGRRRAVVSATHLKISLQLAGTTTAPSRWKAAGDLLENDSTAHTDVDRQLIEDLPLESASSSSARL